MERKLTRIDIRLRVCQEGDAQDWELGDNCHQMGVDVEISTTPKEILDKCSGCRYGNGDIPSLLNKIADSLKNG